jgi:hypothetical protein
MQVLLDTSEPSQLLSLAFRALELPLVFDLDSKQSQLDNQLGGNTILAVGSIDYLLN